MINYENLSQFIPDEIQVDNSRLHLVLNHLDDVAAVAKANLEPGRNFRFYRSCDLDPHRLKFWLLFIFTGLERLAAPNLMEGHQSAFTCPNHFTF